MASRKLNALAAAAQSAASPATHSAALAQPVTTPEVKLSPVHDGKFKPGSRRAKVASVADTATVTHIGPKIIDSKRAQAEGMRAKGSALAQTVWNYATEQEGIPWKRFVSDLFDLDQTGRQQFRKDLADARKNADALLGTLPTRSIFTRISELTTISKALDAGWTKAAAREIQAQQGKAVDYEAMTMHEIVGTARIHLQSAAASSNGGLAPKARGRKATPVLDKVKQFILRTVANDPKQLAAIATMVQAMATRLHTAKQIAKEVGAKPAEVKGDERRETIRAAA